MGEDFARFATDATPSLLRVARRLTGDDELAKDLVQDTLLRVGLSWHKIQARQDVEGPYPYAVVTLIHGWRSWRRRAWRRRERSTDLTNDDRTPALAEPAVDDELAGMLSALPQRQRTALILRFYLDFSEAQTAEALGCSVGTVKSQVSRGLQRLRTAMSNQRPIPTS